MKCLDAPRVEVAVEREGGGGHADAGVRAELAQPVVGAVRPVVRVRVRVRVRARVRVTVTVTVRVSNPNPNPNPNQLATCSSLGWMKLSTSLTPDARGSSPRATSTASRVNARMTACSPRVLSPGSLATSSESITPAVSSRAAVAATHRASERSDSMPCFIHSSPAPAPRAAPASASYAPPLQRSTPS